MHVVVSFVLLALVGFGALIGSGMPRLASAQGVDAPVVAVQLAPPPVSVVTPPSGAAAITSVNPGPIVDARLSGTKLFQVQGNWTGRLEVSCVGMVVGPGNACVGSGAIFGTPEAPGFKTIGFSWRVVTRTTFSIELRQVVGGPVLQTISVTVG